MFITIYNISMCIFVCVYVYTHIGLHFSLVFNDKKKNYFRLYRCLYLRYIITSNQSLQRIRTVHKKSSRVKFDLHNSINAPQGLSLGLLFQTINHLIPTIDLTRFKRPVSNGQRF